MPEYYTAYNDRYLQVHARNLQWADSAPSPIVADTLIKYGIGQGSNILELDSSMNPYVYNMERLCIKFAENQLFVSTALFRLNRTNLAKLATQILPKTAYSHIPVSIPYLMIRKRIQPL